VRSSLHYDPYQNLLVCVAGGKAVTLYAPHLTPYLSPQPLTGAPTAHRAG
jgi:hypothetical protein